MKVKWNRNLDGIRPMITVPETDVLTNGKHEEVVNNSDTNLFPHLVSNKCGDISAKENNNPVFVQTCESPSSASMSSKRSDKSKVRISSLFGLFRVKDKVINDNTSEDCVSNFSELSGATIPSLISVKSASFGVRRKSNYGSRDSLLPTSDRLGFETDTRRRRRANSLLARSSLRRSWQQLNLINKLPVGNTYIIPKERLPNHCLISIPSPQIVRQKSFEHQLSQSSEIRPKSDVSPEVSTNPQNVSKVSVKDGTVENEPNLTGSQSNPNSFKKVSDGKDIENNRQIVMRTDVQTVHNDCISNSDLNEKNGCGCDEVDNKVQSVVNSFDSKHILQNNSKTNFDPKNSLKSLKFEQKLESDKNDAHIRTNASKNGVQQNKICVNQSNLIPNSESIKVETVVKNSDQTIEKTSYLSTNQKSIKQNGSDFDEKSTSNDNKSSNEMNFSPTAEHQMIQTTDDCNADQNSSVDIIKVKVRKNRLPESESVCFSSDILATTLLTENIDNECNNDRAVVLTFINDEPMTSTDGNVETESVDNSITNTLFVKTTPIQGILRMRSRESTSEENSPNTSTKNEVNAKSRKKVHFADNCLHYRNSIHGRSRSVGARHYSSLGVFSSFDRKTANRRSILTNTMGPSFAAKWATNPKNATNDRKPSTRLPVHTNSLNSSIATKRTVTKTNPSIDRKLTSRTPVSNNLSTTPCSAKWTNSTKINQPIERKTIRGVVHTNPITNSSVIVKKTTSRIGSSYMTPSKREIRLTQSAEDKQRIQKLTQLCDEKTKHLENLDINQNYMRLAFDSLAVVIQHLLEQFEPFENPRLKNALKKANERCEQLKDDLDAKDVELNNMRLIFEEQINHLMKEIEKNFSDLNQAKASHESNIKKLKEIHLFEVKSIEAKYEKQLYISQQNCNQLLNEIEEKNIELNECKQIKEVLEFKTKQMEENIMNDKDKKFKYLSEKSRQLELEVDSLKAVMDMKNEKIHTLERKMIETQEKINELPTAKESVKCLQQQVETLQITLDRKIHSFNQLTREHEDLKTEFEKEMREKRRLSMRNEELTFHLNETLNESISGLNNCTNLDLFDGHRFKSPAPITRILHNDETPVRSIHNDETPIKINRSISVNNGPTPSPSIRKIHSKVHRSASVTMASPNLTAIPNNFVHYFPSSGSDTENVPFNKEMNDEVFDSGTSFVNCHRMPESIKKSVKVKRVEKLSDETMPQSVFDSGFEEIQGLNSLPK